MAADLRGKDDELVAERGRDGGLAVGPAEHDRPFVFDGPGDEGVEQLVQAGFEHVEGVPELQRVRRVDDVVAGGAQVD